MDEIVSRQDRIRDALIGLGRYIDIQSTQIKLFPSELMRFRNEFPHLDFEIMETLKTPTSKMFEVKITQK